MISERDQPHDPANRSDDRERGPRPDLRCHSRRRHCRSPSRPRSTCCSWGACCLAMPRGRKAPASSRCNASLPGGMAVDAPNRLLEAAQEIQQFCRSRNWRFCFIGGIAVQRWGEARLTRDADLTVYTGIGDEVRYIEELLGAFASRIERARKFALGHRVLLLRASNGIPLDVTLGALPFED